MRRHQIRRSRPTFQTAQTFHREGSFSVRSEHYLTGQEREIELAKMEEELFAIVKQQFPRTQILEYAILKAHLIIEHALSQYIRCFALTVVSAGALRFTFSQKIEIAYLMGFGANDPVLLPTIEQPNKVRNQVAHTFTLGRAAFDEVLRINAEDYEGFRPKNDRERIGMLRRLCSFICGRISGEIRGTYAVISGR